MESFEVLTPKSGKSKIEKSKSADSEVVELSAEEKEELLNKLDEQLGLVAVARRILENEFASAQKTADFTLFQDRRRKVQVEIAKAEAIQKKLEGKSFIPEISAEYKYKDIKGKENTETISINFEKEIANWTDFYIKHGLTLPANFAEAMQDIWERNADAIEREIQEKGFDKIILIPATVDSADLKKLEEEMTKSYKEEAKKAGLPENDTYLGIDPEKVINSRSGDRMILLHSAPDLTAQPELLKTLDKKYDGEKTNGIDNKAEDFIKAGEKLTITEWFLLQREIWEKKGIHVDGKVGDDGYVKPTWCPGSRLGKEAGSGVVRADWDPGIARVDVYAVSPGLSDPGVGCRLSRCFK